MFCRNTLVLLVTLISCVQAQVFPRVTPSATVSFTNSSKTTKTPKTTSACCFVVQDTVSEVWWQESSYNTLHSVVNLTSYTTYVTEYPNTTLSRTVTNIYTTNATFNFTHRVGIDPITLMINDAANPAATATSLTGQQPITTGGVTIQSPAAFYVYTTVKIITADPITDARGNLACGTVSGFATPAGDGFWGNDVLTFENINTNAQAYFGGPGIVGPTKLPTLTTSWTVHNTYIHSTYVVTETSYGTFYTNSKGVVVTPVPEPSAVVISLTTPFIYAPARGATGTTGDGEHCLQTGGTENWGYVPQTLLDYLISNDQYSAQYPGLASCLPGGPSILQITACETVAPTSQDVGGDLTSSTVIYVKAPGVSSVVPPTTTPQPDVPQSQVAATTSNPPATVVPQTKTQPIVTAESVSTSNPGVVATQPPVVVQQTTSSTPAIGAIINSMFGNPGTTSSSNPPNVQPIVVSPTTIPVSLAPSGLTGSTTTINNTPFIIVPSPTTLRANQPPPTLFATSIVSSVPILIIPVTTIPLSLAPTGLTGSTTIISGASYLIIPTATTIPAPASPPGNQNPFQTTTINGTPLLIIPSTTIALSLAPAGVSGTTTTISGTPYLIIPTATTLPVPSPASPFSTTTQNGTPLLIIPSTTIPLSLVPTGVSGITTTISGTPYLVLTSSTLLLALPTAYPGSITVISGTTELIIHGPTTIPINPQYSIAGKTTVIGGTTMVVVTGGTTVPISATGIKTGSISTTSGPVNNPGTVTGSARPVVSTKSGCGRIERSGLLMVVMSSVLGMWIVGF